MCLSTVPREGTAMTWAAYEALREDDHGRSEYIDGKLVVTPSPSREHQRVCLRLAQVIDRPYPTAWTSLSCGRGRPTLTSSSWT